MKRKQLEYVCIGLVIFVLLLFLFGCLNKITLSLTAIAAAEIFTFLKKQNKEDDNDNTNAYVPPNILNSSAEYIKKHKAYYGDGANMMAEKYSKNSYIQNNSEAIENALNVYNPKFRAKTFCDWAKKVVLSAAEKGCAGIGGILSDDFTGNDLSLLNPNSKIYMCCLHLYREKKDEELLTVYMIISDGCEDAESFCDIQSLPKFFVTFKRKSQSMNMTDGKALAVRCPNCGGDLRINGENADKCPYCGHVVTIDEYDWHMCGFELINTDTYINNAGVILERK